MNQQTPKQLLLIRLGALGDLMHLLPTIWAMHKQLPQTQLHLLTSPLYVDFLKQIPELPITLWSFQKGKTLPQTLQRIQQTSTQLKDAGIDTIINLHPSLKTYAIAFQTLGLLGYQRRHAVYKKQKLAQTGIHERHIERRHAVDDFYAVAQQALDLTPITLPPSERIPYLPIPQAKQVFNKPLAKSEPQSNKPNQTYHVALIPGVGGKRPNRSWPLTQYGQLVQSIQKNHPDLHIQWHLIGGPEEEKLAQQLEQHIEALAHQAHIINHCNKLSILETAQQLAQCNAVIGGDTGPLHVASAVGAPMLGLYAPTSVKRTGPVGKESQVVTLTPPANMSCWPCEQPTCNPKQTGNDTITSCTAHITVDEAVTGLLTLLNNVSITNT